MTKQLIAALSLSATLLCAAESDAPKRLSVAAQTFKEVMDTPDKTIPQDLLNKAQCIIIVPGLKKGAFIVGAKYGKGFVSCRKSGGLGWSAPGSIRVEGGSFGFQIGGSETDVFMLVMNQRGMNRLLVDEIHSGRRCVGRGRPGRAIHPGRNRCRDDRRDPHLVAFPRTLRRHLSERRYVTRGFRLEPRPLRPRHHQ